MRILHVTQVYDPFLEKGGPALKVRSIARHLVSKGHQSTVLTSTSDPAKVSGTVLRDGVEVIYLPSLVTYRATTFNPGVFSFCRRRLPEFDIVHIYGLYDLLGPAVARYARRRNIPYVVEPLGMLRPIDRSFRLKKIWHSLFGERFLRHAAALLATSEQEFDELVADGIAPDRLFLRYNGLELADFQHLPLRAAFCQRWNLPPGGLVVLFLGRLIPRKGADLLISSFAEACPSDTRLVIAGPEGEAGYLHSLKAEAEKCRVENRVLFTGPLFGDQKKEALAAADIFALPSRYENYGNAAAEAIACSVPVIVTETCGISRLVKDKCGLTIERTQTALADALRVLVGDADLRNRFRSACPALAASLSWERLIEPMEQLYLRKIEPRHERR